MGVSKKDPQVRRKELLQDSGLAQALVDACVRNVGPFLRSQYATDVVCEVAGAGAGGVLWDMVPAGVEALHAAIADLAALPPPPRGSMGAPDEEGKKKRKPGAAAARPPKKPKGSEGGALAGTIPNVPGKGPAEAGVGGGEDAAAGSEAEEEHVLVDFFASRTIRRLVAHAGPPPPGSAAEPFAAVLWRRALQSRCLTWGAGHSAKVVAAMATCPHGATRDAALAEINPLIAAGSLPDVARLIGEEQEGVTGGRGPKHISVVPKVSRGS